MNDATLKLLEKALAVSPEDWDTRAHVMEVYLEKGDPERAAVVMTASPSLPQTEEHRLVAARVWVATDPDAALKLLGEILAANRGCARAYLLLARLYLKRGAIEEARRKYGAATVIDESLADPGFEAELGIDGSTDKKAAPPQLVHPQGEVSADEIASALRELERSDPAETAKTTFADVGGMEEVIERIRMDIVYPFKNPELFQKFKKRSGGGILLYGPPGCGKTHLARAAAGECGATFVSIAVTDILSKWLGESERHLHECFVAARRRAPTVIFIDEIDAIGVARADAGASMAPVVNVLLTEMDGISSNNENLLVLAATNAPWRVDSALRRPGRFDRVIFIPPPDEPARAAILRLYLANLPTGAIEVEKLARMTQRFSGADLRAAVERASEKVIAEVMRRGPGAVLTQKILVETIKEMRPSTDEWLETARNYASFANRSGLYDDLAAYLEKH